MKRRCYYMKQQVLQILKTKYPLIQAPMSWITNAQFVGAVANAGGLGVLGPNAGQTTITSDPGQTASLMQAEIQKLRQITTHSFGLNLLTPSTPEQDLNPYSAALLKMAFAERVKYFVTVGSYNRKVFEQIKQHNGIIIHRSEMISLANLRAAEEAGADILVATGIDAGGIFPRRAFGTFATLAEFKRCLHVPLLIAGGINTAKEAKAATDLGADGIYVGTRFIVTPESPASQAVKDLIVAADSDDLEFVFERERSLKTLAADRLNKLFNDPTNKVDLSQEVKRLGGVRPAMLLGKVEQGIIPVNTGVGSIVEEKPVSTLINELSAGLL
ncbi:nitronate monooxygenase [Liquorilactobacillus satsumensis]|uniref:NAD(P)H-dependent flavin oxidoreductase n=1 Tax=Liquorilactobacillus satsumensis TaxID=259059 RepID=UPI002B4BA0AC|nr:nitronate monooxygenase [Liquorilactobacillus satsumensis]